MTTWTAMIEGGELTGYEYGAPTGGVVDGASIDREIAEEDSCSECGGEFEYVPMMCGKSYRAFARCTKCGETIEF